MGTPVVFLDARSKGAEAYKAFAWEFMAKNPTRFAAPPQPVQAPTAPIAPPAEASAPATEDASAPVAEPVVAPAEEVAPSNVADETESA